MRGSKWRNLTILLQQPTTLHAHWARLLRKERRYSPVPFRINIHILIKSMVLKRYLLPVFLAVGLFVCLFVIILHSAAGGHGINYTFLKYHNSPSAAASAQMKTQRPQKSDKIRSPEINSHTAKLQPPHSPENCPLPPWRWVHQSQDARQRNAINLSRLNSQHSTPLRL